MAGRGKVEPKDTMPNSRIISINATNELIIAKEPLHFYEPQMNGLDCGLSFANELLKNIPDSITIMLLPTAVGGSSISQLVNDSIHRNVKLLTNFKDKVRIGQQYGTIQGILWHQGESDTYTPEKIKIYDKQLCHLFSIFRNEIGMENLPILIGELGKYSKNKESWNAINEKIESYIKSDFNAHLIKTNDLQDIGDNIHFNSKAQRLLGKRFAEKFINIQK